MPSFEITPIGVVRNDRTDIQHTDNWGAVRSTITVDERFGEACLQGLDGFSHVEVRELTVVGLDAVTGTPVIDLKPTMAEFQPVNVRQPEWVSHVMSEYFQP
jgi:tRNA (adenine37-N6)-methyltransferase